MKGIVLAGGSGTRMGTDNTNQFIDLAGVPVIARTIHAFQQAETISEIVIVAKKEIRSIFSASKTGTSERSFNTPKIING